jgi:UDP-N-acetyl-L-fucosamine synthase
MLKVITVIGTRPEIIRLSRIISILDKNCDHKIVHTGQNFDFELNEIFFQQLKIRKPDFFLEAAAESPAETIGKIIEKIDKVLLSVMPDAFLVLGDTNSGLSVIAAKKRKIPIFHFEAGNRCFDERVPEEINRKIIDHISDINLTYSDIARENLLYEKFPSDRTINVGSPMFEVFNFYMPEIIKSKVLQELNLISANYILVSAHREENIDPKSSYKKLEVLLNFLAETYNLPVIVSTHPRTRKKINKEGIKLNQLVQLIKPFGFLDYSLLQMKAKFVISDSGSITEESSILNFPALNIRETHERHEGMEEASVMMAGLDISNISRCLKILENQPKGQKRLLNIPRDYTVSNVSEKILRIIHSYTDYVNRVVWKKY